MMMKVMVRKAQECAEQILGRDSPTSSTCKQLLHGNVLTPHNIPEFFLPPRLIRHHPALPSSPTPLETPHPEETPAHAQVCGDREVQVEVKKRWTEKQPSATQRSTQVLRRPAHLAVVPLGEGSLYESPHTRRKESLFHCTVSRLRLEPHTPSVARGGRGPLSDAALRESDAEMDASSSAESTPQATPPARRWTPSPSHLAPPRPFPLELLHCQERLHREHLLLLPTRGRLRLATERPAPSASHDRPPTLRVRVVSVEGLREPDPGASGGGGPRPFSCSLSLCLSPGKLQQQHSATIRHCREPVVFNEDFYFSQPEGQRLSAMQLQLKVKDKSGGLGRGCVLGVISKPLSELMAL